jgi:hypothetical protein
MFINETSVIVKKYFVRAPAEIIEDYAGLDGVPEGTLGF